MRKVKIALITLGALVAIGALVLFGFIRMMGNIGGVPPSYPAADHDKYLTRVAETGLPVIAALRGFDRRHARYPKSLNELAASHPSGVTVETEANEVNGWFYDPNEDYSEFTIISRLGWDPSLEYDSKNSGGSWSFDPGDGSPGKTIVLTP